MYFDFRIVALEKGHYSNTEKPAVWGQLWARAENEKDPNKLDSEWLIEPEINHESFDEESGRKAFDLVMVKIADATWELVKKKYTGELPKKYQW